MRRAIDGWAGPLIDVAAGLIVSGLVIRAIGADPFAAFGSLMNGAFGYPEAIGYTLYYMTTYIFAGLAVWLALQAGIFNIGGEGQIYLGGLGAGLVAMALGPVSGILAVAIAIVASFAFGAAWAFIPALLLARRGSSVVVTTIMFNFIAAALMVWLMTSVLIEPGQAAPETAIFQPSSWMPSMAVMLGWVGIAIPRSPVNLSLVFALLAVWAVRFLIGETVGGYRLRVLGRSPDAALYAGIDAGRATMLALCLSGGLAGLAGVNEVLGVHHRLILDFPAGAGFVGIAVGLIPGRNVWGIIPAALLFAALSQGSLDMVLDNPRINRELVVLIQGLVTLFAGALRGQIRLPGLGRPSSESATS